MGVGSSIPFIKKARKQIDQDSDNIIDSAEKLSNGVEDVTIQDIHELQSRVANLSAGGSGEVSLTTADVLESTDKKYVTDSEKALIGTISNKANASDLTTKMNISTYDNTSNGKVDIAENAEKLGGQLPSYYETTTGSQTKANTAESNAKTYADTKISALINSAPETLNTLNELSQALGSDPNFATTVSTELGKKVDATTYSTHANDSAIHHTHANKSVLDKFAEDVSGNPLYDGTSIGGMGGSAINDTTHSLTTVYSSQKTQDLINKVKECATFTVQYTYNAQDKYDTVTYIGDINRTIQYVYYDSGVDIGKLWKEIISENGKIVTKVYSYKVNTDYINTITVTVS
jgi:translation initiation factor 2B subunit (eIF-2B alpha/beta/delta family)